MVENVEAVPPAYADVERRCLTAFWRDGKSENFWMSDVAVITDYPDRVVVQQNPDDPKASVATIYKAHILWIRFATVSRKERVGVGGTPSSQTPVPPATSPTS